LADSSHIVLQRFSGIDRDTPLMSPSPRTDTVSCGNATSVRESTSAMPAPQSDHALAEPTLDVEADDRRSCTRYLNSEEIESLLNVGEGCGGRAGAREARLANTALELVLTELPARAREVFRAAILRRAANDDLASLFGLSLEAVESDLKLALRHCAARLGR
jgi:RNA polymerase sigma-70 factor, ECF subfamily